MDLNELLNGSTGQEMINQVAQQFGLGKDEAGKAVKNALPVLLGGLQKNASDPQGAEALHKALDNHSDSVLDNLGHFFSNSEAAQQDGLGILRHIFGNQTNDIKQGIAKTSGVNSSKMGPILALLAPLVLSYLSKQRKAKKVTQSSGLGDLIGGLAGGSSQGGGLMDLVTGMLGGGKNNNPLGNILGNILGK